MGFKSMIGTAMLIAISSSAHAQLITVQFEGTVDSISGNAAALIDIGNSFTGSYTYETSTPDTNANTIAGDYTHAIQEITFTVGGFSFTKGIDLSPSFATDSILITNNGFGIDLDAYAAVVPVLSGSDVGDFSASKFGFEMYLAGSTGSVYTDDSLPSDLNLASFQSFDLGLQPTLQLMFTDGGTKSTFASANISSISTVPVPAAVWLFGSGLISLIGVARRKKA